jgi:hypothetical protein
MISWYVRSFYRFKRETAAPKDQYIHSKLVGIYTDTKSKTVDQVKIFNSMAFLIRPAVLLTFIFFSMLIR